MKSLIILMAMFQLVYCQENIQYTCAGVGGTDNPTDTTLEQYDNTTTFGSINFMGCYALTDFIGFKLVTTITMVVITGLNNIQTFDAFNAVKTMDSCFITGNDEMIEFNAFQSLQKINAFVFVKNDIIENFTLPSLSEVGSNGDTDAIQITGCTNLNTMIFPKLLVVNGYFKVDGSALTEEAIDAAFPSLQCIAGEVTCEKCPARIKNLNNSGPCTIPTITTKEEEGNDSGLSVGLIAGIATGAGILIFGTVFYLFRGSNYFGYNSVHSSFEITAQEL
jgi:hypothetical protein